MATPVCDRGYAAPMAQAPPLPRSGTTQEPTAGSSPALGPLAHPTRFLLGAVVLMGCSGGEGPDFGPKELPLAGSELVYTRLAADLLEGQPRWKTLHARPGDPPRVEVACPSRDQVSNSGDQLSLILPPPCAVEFNITSEDGPVSLQAAAGVDLALARRMSGGAPALAVTFQVHVNDKPVAQRIVEVRSSSANDEVMNKSSHNSWQPFDQGEIRLKPGDTVRLSTQLPPGVPKTLPPVPAAFGSLRLEREHRRSRTQASADRPNLVLLVMDTERADRTEPYGYHRPTTPHLKSLADRGLTYEHAYSTSSWTWPATASMLTGRPPTAHGVRVHQSGFLAHELQTLPEALQEVGFSTAAFVANPLVSADHNYSQGFEHFFGTPRMVKGDGLLPEVRAWLTEHCRERFFLYIHLADPHTPHTPSPEEMKQFTGLDEAPVPPTAMVTQTFRLKRGLPPGADGLPQYKRLLRPEEIPWYSDVYDASVHQGDRAVGQVLALLDELQLAGTTVLAYTSDHGEEVLDHKGLGHGHELWEELVRVPLILAGPGLPTGARIQTPVSTRHLAATLARFGGTQMPGTSPGPGDSDIFLGSAEEPDARPVFFETHEGWWRGTTASIYGVRSGDWVLHWGLDGGQASVSGAPEGGEVRLYNLRDDPQQKGNLAELEPQQVKRLKHLISTELNRLHEYAPRQKARAGWGTQALLEAIGYASGDDDD